MSTITKEADLRPGDDDNEWWADSREYTLVSYRLTPGEQGWTCTCPGFANHHTCYHVDSLCRRLGITPFMTPARLAVRRSGLTLESAFDYSNPPTHRATDRSRVRALHIVEPFPLPVYCSTCGHENEPGAVICAVCRHYPQEATLSYSA